MLVNILRILSLIVSLITISAILYYHGFYITLKTKEIIKIIVHLSLVFYTIKYLLYLFYSINRKAYIQKEYSW